MFTGSHLGYFDWTNWKWGILTRSFCTSLCIKGKKIRPKYQKSTNGFILQEITFPFQPHNWQSPERDLMRAKVMIPKTLKWYTQSLPICIVCDLVAEKDGNEGNWECELKWQNKRREKERGVKRRVNKVDKRDEKMMRGRWGWKGMKRNGDGKDQTRMGISVL